MRSSCRNLLCCTLRLRESARDQPAMQSTKAIGDGGPGPPAGEPFEPRGIGDVVELIAGPPGGEPDRRLGDAQAGELVEQLEQAARVVGAAAEIECSPCNL